MAETNSQDQQFYYSGAKDGLVSTQAKYESIGGICCGHRAERTNGDGILQRREHA